MKTGRPKLNRSRRDLGTPELILRRQIAVGAADPALSISPPGILYARGIFDLDQLKACDQFRMLYARANNLARAFGLDAGGNEVDDDVLERINAQYRAYRVALKAESSAALRQVIDVAVYWQRPLWMQIAMAFGTAAAWAAALQHIDFVDLKAGTDRLVKEMGLAK